MRQPTTVEPQFNEPLFNEVLDITNDILCPGQSYSKMYGIEPQSNEPRYNEFFDITNIIRKPKRKIYLHVRSPATSLNRGSTVASNLKELPVNFEANLSTYAVEHLFKNFAKTFRNMKNRSI